jgi:hypothetical protein
MGQSATGECRKHQADREVRDAREDDRPDPSYATRFIHVRVGACVRNRANSNWANVIPNKENARRPVMAIYQTAAYQVKASAVG